VAAMVRALEFLRTLNESRPAIELIRQVVQWVLGLKLKGEMPNLPARNGVLREQLASMPAYLDSLMSVSEILSAWITRAQFEKSINPDLPVLVVLYTIYAKACDPVLEFLRDSGLYSDEQIIELVMQTCFAGLKST
jgi:TetR/AcrR family transcriptional regulator, regulator of autoinduction and epiphytic fitness